MYTLYETALGPGAEAVLAFFTTSSTSQNVCSETPNCFSGAVTGPIRCPGAYSPLGSNRVLYRYLSTSSSGVSNFPDLSLSSKGLANSGSQCWYFSHEPSSLFHHSVLVDLSVSMMMH